jgi:hypothetical protein
VSATAVSIDRLPMRPVRPAGDFDADLADAVRHVTELYRRMPAYGPGVAAPRTLCGLVLKVLERAGRQRHWPSVFAALALMADVIGGLDRDAERLAGAVCEMMGANDQEWQRRREALRIVIRENYATHHRESVREARRQIRQAYRDGVDEGQRAFCEGRPPTDIESEG